MPDEGRAGKWGGLLDNATKTRNQRRRVYGCSTNAVVYFKNFKDFRRPEKRAGSAFPGGMAYKYGMKGIQIWDERHTDMGGKTPVGEAWHTDMGR